MQHEERSPIQPRTWVQRLLLPGLLVLAVIAFLALPAGFPLHPWLSGLGPQPPATATPDLPLRARQVYLASDVPGMPIRLDGRTISMPAIGRAAPLTLSPGPHRLTWGSMPFQSQSCQFSIPLTGVTSCDLLPGTASLDGGPKAPVIELGESLDTLPTSQQSALLQASQSALNAVPATIVQPGERYVTTSGPQVATTAFKAVLTFQIRSARGPGCSMEVFGPGSGLCQLEPGEDCQRFCGLPWLGQQSIRAASGANGWLVLAVVSLSWSYRTPDGTLLSSNQPLEWPGDFALTNHLVMLSIQWNKVGWQVTPLLGEQVGGILHDSYGQPIADDPGCAQAQDLLYNLEFEQPAGSSSPATIHLADGSNPSAGCLVVAGSAEYLMRLGITLPANRAAITLGDYDPSLLQPLTANETQLILSLQPLEGQSISTA